MNKKRLFGYLFVLVSVGNISAQESRLSAQEYKLWYDRPAEVWTGSHSLRERASGSYGIRYARHGADTTERRNHLGRTPQQQRQPQCTGIHSPGYATLYLPANIWKHRRSPPKRSWQRAIPGMPYQSFGDLRIAFPGHTRYTNYYRGTKSRLCPYPRPLCSGWGAIPARNHHFIYRSGNYGTFNRQPSGTDYFQRSTHLPIRMSSSLPKRELRNTFRRIFPARRTERQSGVSGRLDRPEHWRSDGMCRRCAFSRRSR